LQQTSPIPKTRILSAIAFYQQSVNQQYTVVVPKATKPSRFELPKAARVILWTFGAFFALWVLWVVVTLKFFPGMYR